MRSRLADFGRLPDRFRHFTGLAVAEADAALLVADDDEGCEAETTAALHHLGDAVDRYELVDKFAVALFAGLAIIAAPSFLCHCPFPFSFPGAIGRLTKVASPHVDRRPVPSDWPHGGHEARQDRSEAQATFTGSIGESLDATVKDEGAAVKDHFLDASLGGALSDELADGSSGCRVGARLQRRAQIGVEGGGGRKRLAGHVVDDLYVDVLRRAMNRQARAAIGHRLDLTAHAVGATCKLFFPASHFACSLLLLAFFADDPLFGILDALALVGLGGAVFADLRGNLADLLLVDAGHDDFGRLRNSNRDAFRRSGRPRRG